MTAPSRGSLTSKSQIQIQWNALTTSAETGDSPIQSYNLEWDQNGSNTAFVELVGQSSFYTSLSYIKLAVT